MKRRFISFSPHKTALTVSLVMAIGSLLFVIPMAAMVMLMPHANNTGQSTHAVFPGVIFLCMPIFYFVFGYVFTAFSAWVYNRVAKFTGGIEFETAE